MKERTQVKDDKPYVADPTEHPQGLGGAGEITDLYGGQYPRVAPEYGPKGVNYPGPVDQGEVKIPTQGVPQIPDSVWINAMLSRSRKPDGFNIRGIPLQQNNPQQILPRRVGRVYAGILNPGATGIGSNGCYLTSTYGEAQALADNPNGPYNAWPLGIATSSSPDYEHGTEAPLFAVCVAGGTLLVVHETWWGEVHRALAKRHGGVH